MYPSLQKPARLAEKMAEGLQLSVIEQPAIEPVDLPTVKAFCKVEDDNTADDALLASIAKAVRAEAERYANASLITQTLRAYWMYMNDYGVLPRPPIVEILKVETYDGTSWDELSAKGYTVKGDKDLRVCFTNRRFTLSGGINEAARVEYVAGFGYHEGDVPECARNAILDSTLFCYQNRGELATEAGKQIEGILTAVSKSYLDNIKNFMS